MGVVVSPSFLSSSCPALVVLVLALALASSSPPLPPLPLLARRRRRDGGRPVSTRSTLQARARSGGSRVLGCRLLVSMSLLCPSSQAPLSSFHPRSTPRAVAREAGMGGVVVGSSLGAGLMFCVGSGYRVSVTWHRQGCLLLT
jgi:hypothetical protein